MHNPYHICVDILYHDSAEGKFDKEEEESFWCFFKDLFVNIFDEVHGIGQTTVIVCCVNLAFMSVNFKISVKV